MRIAMFRIRHAARKNPLLTALLVGIVVLGLSSLVTKTDPSSGSSVSTVPITSLDVLYEKPSPKPLPDFTNGGVVFFYHTPKTGGTSIRQNFAQLPRVREQFLGSTQDLMVFQYDIEQVLTRSPDVANPEKDLLFIELHGPFFGMLELYPYLQRWKALAAEFHTGFFSFSIVREPISYAVSYFNFFWSKPCTFAGCPYKLYDPTEENLLLTSKPDVQCLYLSRDVTWVSFTDNQTVVPKATALECAATLEIMVKELDWVGTTEGLSTETLPLLSQLIADDYTFAETMPVHNKMEVTQSVIVKKSELQPKSIHYLEELYSNDLIIYDTVKKVFTVDMWSNAAFDPSEVDMDAASVATAYHTKKKGRKPATQQRTPRSNAGGTP